MNEPDYFYWTSLNEWPRWKAACLLAGIEPISENEFSLRISSEPGWLPARFYEAIKDANDNGGLSSRPAGGYKTRTRIPSRQCVAWAISLPWLKQYNHTIPAPLVQMLTASLASEPLALKPLKTVDGSNAPALLPGSYKFNTPDWSFWLAMQEVKVWQACALSLNLEPDKMKADFSWMAGPGSRLIFTDTSFPTKEIKEEFDRRSRLLLANLSDRNHFSPATLNMSNPGNNGVKLLEAAAWLRSIGREIPPELEKRIIEHGPQSQFTSEPTQDAEMVCLAPTANHGNETTHLATKEQIIDAFKCNPELFNDLHKIKKIQDARKVKGRGGRNPSPPLYDPLAFVTYLPTATYGKGIKEREAWAALERHFPERYAEVESYDPRK